jgi:hypothetical protein
MRRSAPISVGFPWLSLDLAMRHRWLQNCSSAASDAGKAIVQDRLKKLHDELETGVRVSLSCTVRRATED